MTNDKTTQKKKLKKNAILLILTLLIADVFVLEVSGYMQLYPRLDFFAAFSKTMDGLMQLNFIIPKSITVATPAIVIVNFFIALGAMYVYTQHKRDEHADLNTVSGSAKWNTDMERWNKKYSDPANSTKANGPHNMILTQDVYLSMNTRQTRRNNNVLVIGGSGAGKSRFFVKPNLCQMPLNCNFICTDPSGELLAETGSMLEGAGFKIKVFNIVNMKESDRYNPLKYINTENDVILLTDCILANTTDPNKKGGDDFWEKAQKLMFQSFLYLIWKHGKELRLPQNLNTLMELMTGCNISEDDTTEQGGLTAQYFQAVETSGWYFDADGKFEMGEPPENSGLEYYKPCGPSDICVKQYKKFKAGAGKTLKSILISAMARLSTLDSQEVSDLLAEDDIELNKIGDEKTALFVIIPQEHESFNFLAAMLYTQLFQSLYYHAENECQGNYIVVDNNGENVRSFEVLHGQDEYDSTAEIKTSENIIDFEAKSAEEVEKEDEDKKQKKNHKVLSFLDFLKAKKKNERDDEQQDDDAKNETEGRIDADGDLTYMPENKEKVTDENAVAAIGENAFDHAIDRSNTNPDDDAGEEVDEVQKAAEEFARNAVNVTLKEILQEIPLKNKKIEKKTTYKIIIPDKDSENKEYVVGIYGNLDFAKKKCKAIKNGCTVKRCGLYLPYHVRFILDEFANIGQIPDFTKKLATMRKYEISSTVILQNLAQIKNMYKDDWGSIMGNCDSFLFLGCPEMDTLKYVSEMLGKQTIITRNNSISKGGKGSSSLSYQRTARELATADELRRMKDDECVFVLRGEQPFKVKKHQFVNHDNYKYTADANHNNLYKFRKKRSYSNVKKQTQDFLRQFETMSASSLVAAPNKVADNSNIDNDIDNIAESSILTESRLKANNEKAQEYYNNRNKNNETVVNQADFNDQISINTLLNELDNDYFDNDIYDGILSDNAS